MRQPPHPPSHAGAAGSALRAGEPLRALSCVAAAYRVANSTARALHATSSLAAAAAAAAAWTARYASLSRLAKGAAVLAGLIGPRWSLSADVGELPRPVGSGAGEAMPGLFAGEMTESAPSRLHGQSATMATPVRAILATESLDCNGHRLAEAPSVSGTNGTMSDAPTGPDSVRTSSTAPPAIGMGTDSSAAT
eukprot:scaffold19184_cov112-Isochrysis_galbana.AAC.3